MAYGACLSGSEFGILTGIGFSALYVVTALVSGRLVDSYSPANVLLVGLLVWSVATAAQALAHSFSELLVVRLIQGGAEAVAAPASYALVARLAPASQRSLANGVFSVGIYAGGAAASLSILLARYVGWRSICIGLGSLGLSLGCLLWLQWSVIQSLSAPAPAPAPACNAPAGARR